jgi:hypothetical protein
MADASIPVKTKHGNKVLPSSVLQAHLRDLGDLRRTLRKTNGINKVSKRIFAELHATVHGSLVKIDTKAVETLQTLGETGAVDQSQEAAHKIGSLRNDIETLAFELRMIFEALGIIDTRLETFLQTGKHQVWGDHIRTEGATGEGREALLTKQRVEDIQAGKNVPAKAVKASGDLRLA